MKLVKAGYEILTNIKKEEILQNIEFAGRTCYKSEDKITDSTSKDFVKMLIGNGHLSVLEHEKITVKFIIDRGVSHELVRHRIASFSQESTRYCNYSKDKFDNQLTFIIPEWISDEEIEIAQDLSEFNYNDISETTKQWYFAMLRSEQTYNDLTERGWQPQQARSILPNSLKTEIVVTANLREWRTIFEQRTSKKAHPQMREVMIPLLEELKSKLPVVFDDINNG
jgi:thymidylate synthase (FAD)